MALLKAKERETFFTFASHKPFLFFVQLGFTAVSLSSNFAILCVRFLEKELQSIEGH